MFGFELLSVLNSLDSTALFAKDDAETSIKARLKIKDFIILKFKRLITNLSHSSPAVGTLIFCFQTMKSSYLYHCKIKFTIFSYSGSRMGFKLFWGGNKYLYFIGLKYRDELYSW